MRHHHWPRSILFFGTLLTVTCLAIAGAGGTNSHGLVAAAPATGSYPQRWTQQHDLIVPRSGHIAAPLPDGTVLVAGGIGGQILKSAEVFNPATEMWTAVPDMTTPRYLAAAASLPDGDVLVVGGCVTACDFGADTASAERFDWRTSTWHAAGSMAVTRSRYHILVPLADADGRVLVVGGVSGYNTYLASAEIYNPVTNAWTPAGSMSTPRHEHRATRLADGRVLVTGGLIDGGVIFASAERYDPNTNTWAAAAPMSEARWAHSAVLLTNGKVLVAGGYGTPSGLPPSATSELYDPDTNTWSAAASLNQRRAGHQIALLDDGTTLAVGGCGESSPDCNSPSGFLANMLASAERFDPTTGPAGTWTTVDSLVQTRNGFTLTALSGQRALAVGGSYPISQPLANAELYDAPLTATPTQTDPATSTPPTGPCAPQPADLVAWWPFDEASGPTASDLGPYQLDGAIAGANSTWRPNSGHVHGAIEFTPLPLGGYVRVPHTKPLDLGMGTREFTIDAWLMFPQGSDPSTFNYLLGKRRFGAGEQGYDLLVRNNRIELDLFSDVGGLDYHYYFTGAVFTTGVWQHMAVTVKRDGGLHGIQFYIDGLPVPEITLDGDAGRTAGLDITNTEPFTVGGSITSGGFGGLVDELHVYRRALTPEEVKAIADAGAAGVCTQAPAPSDTPTATPSSTPAPTDTPTSTATPTNTATATATATSTALCSPIPANMVAWWPMDDAAGPIVDDRWLYNNDGIAIGGLGHGDGYVGMGERFIGTNYVRVPPSSVLDIGPSGFSIDAWMRPGSSGTTGIRTIADKRQSANFRGYRFAIMNGRLSLLLADATGSSLFVTPAVMTEDGKWHHVAVAISAPTSGGITFFLDGTQLATVGNGPSRSWTLANTSPLRLGGSAFESQAGFIGILDEVQMYRRALSAAEIKRLVVAGTYGKCTPTPSATSTATATRTPTVTRTTTPTRTPTARRP